LEIQLEVKLRELLCCPFSIGGLLIATHVAEPVAVGPVQVMLLRFVAVIGCLGLAVSFAGAESPVEPTPVDFGRDIRPLLSDRCFQCHGPDSATREAGLRLDVREVAVGELESGTIAIVPGRLDTSELIVRIDCEDESMRMPPIDSGKSLSEEERALLRRWIAEGAPYKKHWAFVPPQRPNEPTPKHADWARNPIDAFILAELEAVGDSPSAEAEPHDLVRRLYLDLTGLPPAPQDVDKILGDSRPDAYERLVDELMKSPHYGERMAIEWLDGARFADSNGYQNDFRRTMWPWRDWVINAYNANMPYDQFVTEQLAGDLLPNTTQSQRVATGFNRNNRTVTEAGSIEEEWRIENVMDRVETSGNVFLGLTIGCARCHDHKFDPISQKEFYEFYSFFNNVNELGVYSETVGNVAPLAVHAVPGPGATHETNERRRGGGTLGMRFPNPSFCCPNGRSHKHNCEFRGYKMVSIVENVILEVVQERLVTPEFLDQLVSATNEFLQVQAQKPKEDEAPIKLQLKELRRRQRKLANIIAESGRCGVKALVKKLENCESDMATVRQKLRDARLRNEPPPKPLTLDDVKQELVELRDLLVAEKAVAAPILRALTGPIIVEQVVRTGEKRPI
jgi:hypothetical protein